MGNAAHQLFPPLLCHSPAPDQHSRAARRGRDAPNVLHTVCARKPDIAVYKHPKPAIPRALPPRVCSPCLRLPPKPPSKPPSSRVFAMASFCPFLGVYPDH
ncbi:uncharacterized protein K441DRAFT_656905 [Cenococcum geophilum 1.58]|uniref:uncharacterized protein n=1 Tax=Cenococcum geophilum 1.58 TaxID=794803 RepID=UPI00358E32EA|nr:hypothetical protein K441DRAFT_656905 [Cenococcum geophilum 1.58]